MIFGVSAGWTLEERFLSRFKRIVAVEPDPVARAALRVRFPRLNFEMISREDLLPWLSASPEVFSGFLAQYPKAAVLFSNVLGQIRLLQKTAFCEEAEARRRFFLALGGREWASYHDLLSSTHEVKSHESTKFKGVFQLEELANRFFPAQTGHKQDVVVIDHDTSWLLKDREWRSLVWRLRPRQTHLIACVSQQVGQS